MPYRTSSKRKSLFSLSNFCQFLQCCVSCWYIWKDLFRFLHSNSWHRWDLEYPPDIDTHENILELALKGAIRFTLKSTGSTFWLKLQALIRMMVLQQLFFSFIKVHHSFFWRQKPYRIGRIYAALHFISTIMYDVKS